VPGPGARRAVAVSGERGQRRGGLDAVVGERRDQAGRDPAGGAVGGGGAGGGPVRRLADARLERLVVVLCEIDLWERSSADLYSSTRIE
jgi:hypothetical protein